MRIQRALLWSSAAVAAFCLGRHVSHRSVDFIVYYHGARSLLAGRTDLYSSTFAWGPPMIYVYPPLFMLLVFPIGWLSFANAFGVCFTLAVLATAWVVGRAYRQWRPRHRAGYFWLMLALVGPFAWQGLRYGNVQPFIVLLVAYAVLSWSTGKLWRASIAVALGGAVKIFPLFLLPVFLVRGERALAARVIGFTCLLWMLPAVFFGPRRTASLYQQWANVTVLHLSRFESQRSLDESLVGAMKRWLTRVDYSERRDSDYPQADLARLSHGTLKALTYGVEGVVLALSLWMCAVLRGVELRSATVRHRQSSVVTAGVIFVTGQLVLGPYSTMLYFSGWLLVALALPAIAECPRCLYYLWLAAGTVNLTFFLVPGRMSQRALQAYGVFTLLGLFLWILSMRSGWLLARENDLATTDCEEVSATPSSRQVAR